MVKYYSNAIIATYMHDTFGVEFYGFNDETNIRYIVDKQEGGYSEWVQCYLDNPLESEKLFIKETSNKLFKPRLGDAVDYLHPSIGFIPASIGYNEPLWKATDGKLHPLPDGSEFLRISKREQKPFFTPSDIDVKHPKVWHKDEGIDIKDLDSLFKL